MTRSLPTEQSRRGGRSLAAGLPGGSVRKPSRRTRRPVPKRADISSILVIGAGSIVIGQACELDYSGTQAVGLPAIIRPIKSVPYATTIAGASAMIDAITAVHERGFDVAPLQSYDRDDTASPET